MNAAPGSGGQGSDQTVVRCERTFTVYKLENQGVVELKGENLTNATKTVYGLDVVRPNARGSNEAACDKLENQ